MPRAGRFALVLLLSALGAVACSSKSVLLVPRDGGAGAGGSSGASGSGGSTGGAAGASGTGGASGIGGGGTVGTGQGGASGTGGQIQCTDPSFADCTSAPGCETMLGTDTDCARCGDRSCAIANTLFSCSSANGCTSAVCAVGYANCDRSSPDCEAIIAAGASCVPAYRGSVKYVTGSYNSAAAAIAPDGSFFFGGTFKGTVNFGTVAAKDTMVAPTGLIYGFISRFNADGSYAWTRAFPGSQETLAITGDSLALSGLAATPDGGVVAIGYYSGSIDLDPGAGVESHQTTGFRQHEGFVVKLAADGSFAWGGTITTQSSDSASGDAGAVASDSAGAIYVAARYAGDVDLDPSGGTAMHTSRSSGSAAVAGALLKLTPAGKLAWLQSADTGACVPSPASIALATDGAIWVLGITGEGGCASPVASGGGGHRRLWSERGLARVLGDRGAWTR